MNIVSLPDVAMWLTGKSGSVTIDPADFSGATIVNALLGVLGGDAITLDGITISGLTTPTITLSGTTTLTGDTTPTTFAFVFTQPDASGPLVCELTATLDPSVSWTLFEHWDVGITGLVGQFTANTDLSVIGLAFGATVTAGTSFSIGIDLNIPAVDGEWTLKSTAPLPAGSFDQADLKTLLAGNDVVSVLPTDSIHFENLSVKTLEASFAPYAATPTFSLLRLALKYEAHWTFGSFTLEDVDLDMEVHDPCGTPVFQGTASAKTSIGGTMVQVGAQFPDKIVYAQLAPGSTLHVADVFTYFGLSAISGNFAQADISTLRLFIAVEAGTFTFSLIITQPFTFLGDVMLQSFDFEIGTTGGSASGMLTSSFLIGQTAVTVSGNYAASGTTLTGMATNITIADIATQFGGVALPPPIVDLTLSTLMAGLTTSANGDTFNFTATGTTVIAGATVSFNPVQIEIDYDSGSFSGKFSATIVIPAGTFMGDFTKTAAGDFTFSASYAGSGLTFSALATAFGFTLPSSMPSALDFDLTAADLFYDCTGDILVIGVTSTHGKATFVTMPIETGGPQQYFFILTSDQSFSLSNLPLVGTELAAIENFEVGGLELVIASTMVTAAQAMTINAQITANAPGYPQMPAAGTSGTFVISASMQAGDDSIPLSFSAGGSSSTALVASSSDGSASPDGVIWATVQKSFGPVSIARIGALFQSDVTPPMLWFEIDATLQFGPFSLSLDGLGAGSPLNDFAPQFTLGGLGISYSNPPLEIAGGLVNLAAPGSTTLDFEGGITIGTSDFTLEAFGYYGDGATPSFPSLFVVVDLDYAFGGPPAFYVTGAQLGFGYNSSVALPTIDQVSTFPFLKPLPSKPLDALSALLDTKPQTVSDQRGDLWFAAGINFTSFSMIDSTAVVFVETGSNLVISLLGISKATFPQVPDPPPADPPPAYAYIELDLDVYIAPDQGVFSAQAVLAPSSFLLDQACQLTGGFAFLVWYGDNAHAGEFVLTLGGYNSGFTPPSYYPSVPEVGFDWSLDDTISISGGAYFALTPSVLMVGGKLDATYSDGSLQAWFDAHADAIIQWNPFYFTADVGISVGASYTMDLLFTTATFHVELGCDLEVWGPPTGGQLTVDWSIISFTIDFGTSKGTPPSNELTWQDVMNALPNNPNILSISPASGLMSPTTAPASPSASASGPAPWIVRGSQFSFTTGTPIPASSATLNGGASVPQSSPPPFGVNLIPSWTDVTATHAVTISGDVTDAFQLTAINASVPAALWSPTTLPSNQVPTGTGTVDGQIVGVTVTVNPPNFGNSAGAVFLTNLKQVPISSANGVPQSYLPLTGSAEPSGDSPVVSSTTVATIANPENGIASANVTRNAIHAALQSIHYAPADANDPMKRFVETAGCAFAAEPLLVS